MRVKQPKGIEPNLGESESRNGVNFQESVAKDVKQTGVKQSLCVLSSKM